jgi:hypothetical protein
MFIEYNRMEYSMLQILQQKCCVCNATNLTILTSVAKYTTEKNK